MRSIVLKFFFISPTFIFGGKSMAQIIENKKGRRSIKLSTDDVISIVREYQNAIQKENTYFEIRNKLTNIDFYLPEDI